MRSIIFLALFVSLTAQAAELLKPDAVVHAGLKPEDAVKAITLPPGFKASLFAGEPDIVQPVAFTFDDRGRLWVAEANTYPKKAPPGQGHDRIILFEDSTGAGHFDKRTVFIEGLNLVSGIEVGFGGVWVGQAPEMLFIPILADDKPGNPEVLLDGFAYGDTHETLNSFNWGPDGWLYGCHGVFNASKVGKPGTADKDRISMNAAVWRFHPTKKIFEIFAEGGSNQWGIDWDEHGQMFMTCCVIPHLYHVIQGGRYSRQAGPHADPYTFDDIKTIADHLHWQTGAANQWAANGKSDAFGGGHAHAGAMIYQGDNWPAQYRNQIFMNNIHGNRTNEDLLERSGSGYVGRHGLDFMRMNDSWSRLINLKYGPDGGVYAIDWYDKQACHLPNPEVWDRSNGRIYKITYGDVKPVKVDLAKFGFEELVKLQKHPNDWFVRHSRRLLQEREFGTPGAVAFLSVPDLNAIQRLHVLSMLHSTGTLTDIVERKGGPHLPASATYTAIRYWLEDTDEFVRAALIQILFEDGNVPDFAMEKFMEFARSDKSPVVRRALASAACRMPADKRWDLLEILLTHGEDASDQNLPLMYWYATADCVPTNFNRSAKLAMKSEIPLTREFIARRLAMMTDQPDAIVAAVSILLIGTDKQHTSTLTGILAGFAGKRSVQMPWIWKEASEKLEKSVDPVVKQKTMALATIFGDQRALATLRNVLENQNADLAQRQNALESLLAAKDSATLTILQTLVADPQIRGGAIRGLAAYDDAKTAGILVDGYISFDADSKLATLNTLASRISSAQEFVAAIKAKKIPQADLTAPTVRNLNSLNDKSINEWIAGSWGAIRATPDDKIKEIARYKKVLTPQVVARGDAGNGRAIFVKTCMQCHTLFDAGAKIGPDLTGSNRANVDYLLENIVDPSAVIGKDYLMVNAKTKDGRFIDGIIKSQTDDSITFATVNELITLPKNEIASQKTSNVSMMPEGLMAGLNEKEVRDLIRYLASPAQVELPK